MSSAFGEVPPRTPKAAIQRAVRFGLAIDPADTVSGGWAKWLTLHAEDSVKISGVLLFTAAILTSPPLLADPLPDNQGTTAMCEHALSQPSGGGHTLGGGVPEKVVRDCVEYCRRKLESRAGAQDPAWAMCVRQRDNNGQRPSWARI